MTTAAELRAAWDAMRNRYAFRHWPNDYDAVMADPVACRLVRLEATGRRRRRPGADPPLNTGRTSCWPTTRAAPPGVALDEVAGVFNLSDIVSVVAK